jgi:thiazole tautomerase (transcriptional regulator TenI)
MRPLPRLHAVTDAGVLDAPDFAIRAAAIAAAGPAVALHARDRSAGGARLSRVTLRLLALARPPEAAVFVNGRPDIAAATGAQGVQLAVGDLSPRDARLVLRWGWIGRSVHSPEEAAQALEEGADFLIVGSVYPSDSHPGRPGAGLDLVRKTARFGLPVIAIGGVNASRAAEVAEAGAYGAAAIGALWRASDSAAAAQALLEPWVRTS